MELAALKDTLIEDLNQAHLFPKDAAPEDEVRLLKELAAADATYPGGLRAYVTRARSLFQSVKDGSSPFEGYEVQTPVGERLIPGSAEFVAAEEEGIAHIKEMAFVVVAGGLGERLGYQGIKLGLPTESCTGTTYAEFYCRFIFELQQMAERQNPGERIRLPLAVMTSDDTHTLTVNLFQQHNFFGLDREDVHFLKQQKVPALLDLNARIATRANDKFALEMKPHGHGDVHSLLLSSGLIDKWHNRGVKWLSFTQDTNAAVFRVILATVGVSVQKDFAMNSITVPRRPGEAVGSICRLVSKDRELTMNVEYNVLDALLKANGKCSDVAGSDGFSVFPGNTNALVLKMEPYAKALHASKGLMPEFVNPKFKDTTKTEFKSPTRLESMMQDLPLLLSSDDKVGFVELARWTCFSPVKNSLADAMAKCEKGLPPECALSGESDLYFQNGEWMKMAIATTQENRKAGASLTIAEPESVMFGGVQYRMGPRIVLSPTWGVSINEIRDKLIGADIEIKKNSVLIICGNVKIKRLYLDGALILRAAPGASILVENLEVKNEGWRFQPLDASGSVPPAMAIRAFSIQKMATAEFEATDGTLVISEP